MIIKENIHQAKTHFSKLIEHALNGDEVIVAKAGKALVKIVPIEEPEERVPGGAMGQVRMDNDFNDPLDPNEVPGFGL
ncbi:MAG: type II toxin-antitoxin system prevent-host-death family antitoxin [Lentisphaerales bacterium]|nr:type II toxin-antitoxin system prevent-host-death family antitoxin [Lentisphaerales bacterium]